MKTVKRILNEFDKVKRVGMTKLVEWLCDSDYFAAPCSTKYHCSYDGGLAEHSWNVYKLFKEKNKRYKLGLSDDCVIICGLLHDVCKVNLYKKIAKQVVGSWQNNPGVKTNMLIGTYEYNDKFPLNHGHKSVIILQRFIKLTDEECCLIAWHMSGFDISPYSKQTYYNAVEMYPAIVALFSADYEATTFLEKNEK